MFSRIDRLLGHKTHCNKFKKNEILSITFLVEAVEQFFFEAGFLVRLISTKGSKTK